MTKIMAKIVYPNCNNEKEKMLISYSRAWVSDKILYDNSYASLYKELSSHGLATAQHQSP